MRISDIVAQAHGPLVSFEIFPQMTVHGRSIFEVVDELAGLDPSFISVTYGAGGNNRGDLVRLCTHIAGLGISPLPHFTVVGHSEREVKSTLSRYQDYGFENVLALRGDPPRDYDGPRADLFQDFSYCSELIDFITSRFDACVGAAVYPEGRPDCVWEDNLAFARLKEELGAEFFITQLFFDNSHFYRFVEQAGLNAPVIPGILPVFGKRQVDVAQTLAGATIPPALGETIRRFEHDAASLRQAGIEYAAQQIRELAEEGFDFVHLFTLNRPRDTADLLREIGLW